MIERHFSPEELSDLLPVSVDTIYRLIHRGELKAIWIGRRYGIPESEVERFLNGESGEVVQLREAK